MSDTTSDDTATMRPLVPNGRQGDFGMYAFIAVLLIGGIWLFATLNSARQDAQVPATFPTKRWRSADFRTRSAGLARSGEGAAGRSWRD